MYKSKTMRYNMNKQEIFTFIFIKESAMTNVTKTRIPIQKRSIQKKADIRKAALSLFCENGFMQTTTNHIAKAAGMSVGSLYEYYANKEDILFDIVDGYFTDFLNAKDQLKELFFTGIESGNKRDWIKSILYNLIASHEATKKFNIELHYLYFQYEEVAKICDKQKSIIREIAYDALLNISDELKVKHLEIASIMFCDMLEKIVDRICLSPLDCDQNLLINEGVELLYCYLFKPSANQS